LSHRNLLRRLVSITSLLVSLACAQTVTSQTRIASAIENEERVTVKGTTSPLLARSVETGRMAGDQNLGRMILLLAPTQEQDRAADQFVGDLLDPSSPSYHKWLTPAEFGARFGVADADAMQVQQWLRGRGLTVQEVSQSRRFIVFTGTVSQVQDAFSTELHTYTYKQNGKDTSFISNSADFQIPAALQAVVKGVVRLHSDPRASTQVVGGKVHFDRKTRQFTFSDGSHVMAPADFARIYNLQPLYDAGIDGTGQTIAIVGRSQIDPQNVTDFRSLLGLPANDPEIILNGDDPGQTTEDMPEALADVTWSGAVAPMAHIKMVVSQSNFADGIDASAAYIVDHNLAPVMSTSYGQCEQSLGPVQNAFYNSLWQQAAAQGITSFVSAGDSGGAGCDPASGGVYASGVAVSGIASTPYNVAVGGTQFDDRTNPSAYWSSTSDPTTWLSALGYIPEKAWNESSNDPNYPVLLSGGGGVSTLYAKPNWQTAAGVPNDGKRDVPDFSLSASVHDGYLVCLYGGCDYGSDYFYYFGGTSLSSPAAAGIMALVNQKMGGQPQGLANYVFYRLASTPGVYHDTSKGDNKVPDANGQFSVGYSAGTGYDLATGLGSFDATALVNSWQAASSTLGTATTVKLGAGQTLPVVHGTPLSFNAAVKCSGASCKKPTGEVALMATSVAGDSVAAGSGLLTPGTPASTSNIQTGTVPGGTYGVTARYSGDGTYYSSTSSPVQVTVTPEPSQTYVGALGGGSFNISPISVSYDEPLLLGVIVAGNSGYGYPTGQLTIEADGQRVQTVLSDGVTPSPVVLNYGEKSAIVAGGNIPASQSSTVSYLAQGLPVGTHQLQANYPGDNSFSSSTSPGSTSHVFDYTVTKANSFIADFFADGTPVMNVPIALAGQIGLVNYCAPFGGTITATDVTRGTPVPLGSGTLSSLYCDSYYFPATFTTPGMADPQCPNASTCRHIVRIDYSGDGNVNAATKTFPFFYVNANAASSTSLVADTSAALASSPVSLTATVITPVPLHLPTGQMVSFMDGSTLLGTTPLENPTNFFGGQYGLTAQLVVTSLSGGPHNLTASYAGDAVLAGSDSSSSSSPVLVTIMDYSFQGTPATLTIKDGQSGTATLSVFPLGGFAQAVQFSCGTLPSHVSCNFSHPSVIPDGVHPSIITLTVNTSGLQASQTGNAWWGVSSTLALAGVLLPFGGRRRSKTTLAALSLILVALCGVGCGPRTSNQTGATLGTFTITVTATSGAMITGKAVALTVNIVK
jgi:hypothetical protein